MDITLERIMSLLPKKQGGGIQHGAKKEFARNLGLSGSQVISDWVSGRSTSYKNYLYQISEKYDVSVEWLKGETDIKSKPAAKGGLDDRATELLRLFEAASPELQAAALAVLKAAEEQK